MRTLSLKLGGVGIQLSKAKAARKPASALMAAGLVKYQSNAKLQIELSDAAINEMRQSIDLFLDLIELSARNRRSIQLEGGSGKEIENRAAVTLMVTFRHFVYAYTGLAKAGELDLIRELPVYATHLVEALEELSPKYSAILAEHARGEVAWPIMAARHYPKESDFKALADLIQLGSDAVVNVSPRARYKLGTPVNRFLLHLFGGAIRTTREFYFIRGTGKRPKLSAKTLPYYLDEFIMPLLDEIREKEGSWEGIPAIAAIVKGIPYESEHRSAVRNRSKRALKAMSAPGGD